MAKIDPEQEKRRLAEFYSRQLDGELERVASQAAELTEIAREALRAELAKRSLQRENSIEAGAIIGPSNETESEHDDLQHQRLVILRQFRDLPEALLAHGCLESAGIEAFLVDDNMVRMDWFWSNAVGGVKLQVRPEDVDEANQLLEQPIPEGFDVEG
jgi:hypothetical protein